MTGRQHFYFLIHGTFAEKVQPGEPVISTTSITGMLLNVTFKSSPTGKIMKIHMADEDNFYMVSMFLSSRPAYAFLMLLGGLDHTMPLTLKVDRSTGRDNIKAYQNGIPVPWRMDAPGFALLQIQQKVERLLERLHGVILPAIQSQGNPFPYHSFYKPPKLTKAEKLGITYPFYGTRG